MWSADLPEGNEMAKCRRRVASFIRGTGLDLGCAKAKICENAIGIDNAHKEADVCIDLGAVDALRIFSDGAFDYVFSSHVLEDFYTTEAILAEWWRVVRPGGHIILYCPDPDYYPKIGTAGANPAHKKDLYYEDVWSIVKGFGNAKLISASRHNESNEYSWQLVVQKKQMRLKNLRNVIGKSYRGMAAFPRNHKKEALVIRYGAFGDSIMSTPVVRQLKKEGYYVVYNCSPNGAPVLGENPNIDEYIIQEKDVIPNIDLDSYWAEIGRGFDKVINLTGTVEQKLLKVQGREEFNWSHKKRKKECNKNYIDYTMEVAGYPEMKGETTELFFTGQEEKLARMFFEQHKDKFIVIWALSGSSIHKVYPWSEYVAGTIWQKHEQEVLIITVGDDCTRMIEWSLPNTLNRCGVFTIRQSMLMTKYANLVIGPETGIMNAAGCFDTPKIVFMSHSSEENLTKYWSNITALHPENCRCHPCHRLIYVDSCPKGKITDRPRCAENIRPETVYKAFTHYFKDWKNGKEEKREERCIRQEKAPRRRVARKSRPQKRHKRRRVLDSKPKSIQSGRESRRAG